MPMSYHAPVYRQAPPQSKTALLMDFENLIIGLENNDPTPEKPFSIAGVIQYLERQFGPVIYRKAFADWSNSRFRKYAVDLSRVGVELQHVVRTGFNNKNAADTHLVIEAMDCMLHYPNIDTYVIASGDLDFLPLISKIKASGRKIVGLGSQGTVANVLAENCDEYLTYGPKGVQPRPRAAADLNQVRQILRTLLTAERQGTIRRVYGVLKEQIPGFMPRNYGFHNIFDLLRQITDVTLTTLDDGDEIVRLVEGGGAGTAAPIAGDAALAPVTAGGDSDGPEDGTGENCAGGAGDEESAIPNDLLREPVVPPESVSPDPGFADYMIQTRWFIHDPRARLAILTGLYRQLSHLTSSISLESLRQQIPEAAAVTEKEWFGTLFSLIHGGCLWEDPSTSEKPLAQRAVSLFRGIGELEEFVVRYYCSLFHKAFADRADVNSRLCSALMYGDHAPEHLALFDLVLRRLSDRS